MSNTELLKPLKNVWEGVSLDFRLCVSLRCFAATPSCYGAASGRLRRKMEPSLEKLLGLLAESRVQFVVVGGVAVALHGYLRLTDVSDLLVSAEASNLGRLLNALM